MKKRLLVIGAAAMIAPLISSAGDYRFIISGDPIAASTANRCEFASVGTALVTSARTATTVANSLEARYRTFDQSVGVALRSGKFNGMIILVR
jgi:hypothetical protein